MSDLTDMTKTSEAELLVVAQTLVKTLALLDELKEEQRQRGIVEETRRRKWEEAGRDLERRIKEVQGAYELERRMLCGAEGSNKVFQVGDKAVVVTWPVGANLANVKIMPLARPPLSDFRGPVPREGGQS